LSINGNGNTNCISKKTVDETTGVLFLGIKENKDTYEVIYKQNNSTVDDIHICRVPIQKHLQQKIWKIVSHLKMD
jgi:hypothetical protein